jgi:hypothetical protein
MALPPLELFSLKGKAALLPGGFSVYLRDLRQLHGVKFPSGNSVTDSTKTGHTS